MSDGVLEADLRLPAPSPARKLLAWCVHFYTALGLLLAGLIAVLIVEGHDASFRGAFLLMLIAVLVDATDGTLARLVRVKEVLPGFDGRRLDDIIDFQTYTSLPLLLVWRAGLVPAGWEWCLLVPLLASVYGFCQTSAKTEDGFFLGFPSYWNVMAFYLYFLRPPGALAVALLLLFAGLTFVPFRYLYPSLPGRLNRIFILLGVVWVALVLWMLGAAWAAPTDRELVRQIAIGSLFYPVYYLLASWWISLRVWRRRRPRRRSEREQADIMG